MALVAITLVGVGSVVGATDAHSGPNTTTIVLQSPTAYTPKAPPGGGTDDYHCTLLNPHLTHDALITAIDFQPNSPEVHHEITYAVPPDLAAAAEAQNDGGRGWTCFGESGLDTGGAARIAERRHPLAHGLGAGAQPLEGTSRNRGAHARWDARDHAGALQHARWGPPCPLQADAYYRAGRHAPAPATPEHRGRSAGHPVRPGRYRAYVQQGSGARQRGSALRDGPGTLGRRAGIAVWQEPSDPPVGDTTTCTWPLYTSGNIVELAPHMHLLGVGMKFVLNPGTPAQQTLLNVTDYDFHYQRGYVLPKPIPITAGDKIGITCTYNPQLQEELPILRKVPPHFVTWGDGSTDEMCLGLIFTTPPDSVPESVALSHAFSPSV